MAIFKLKIKNKKNSEFTLTMARPYATSNFFKMNSLVCMYKYIDR